MYSILRSEKTLTTTHHRVEKRKVARLLPASPAHTINPAMPQEHNHDHCHDHAHDHDHDHDAADLGPQDSLYSHIDRANVVALNTSKLGEVVIKPWDKRLDEAEVGLPSSQRPGMHTHYKSSPLSLMLTIKCPVVISQLGRTT